LVKSVQEKELILNQRTRFQTRPRMGPEAQTINIVPQVVWKQMKLKEGTIIEYEFINGINYY